MHERRQPRGLSRSAFRLPRLHEIRRRQKFLQSVQINYSYSSRDLSTAHVQIQGTAGEQQEHSRSSTRSGASRISRNLNSETQRKTKNRMTVSRPRSLSRVWLRYLEKPHPCRKLKKASYISSSLAVPYHTVARHTPPLKFFVTPCGIASTGGSLNRVLQRQYT